MRARNQITDTSLGRSINERIIQVLWFLSIGIVQDDASNTSGRSGIPTDPPGPAA